MNYELTHAKTREDLAEIADMMAKVFASRSYFDFYRTRFDYQTKDPFYKPEFSRIVKMDGRIVSHVSIVEKHLRIGRSVVKVAGIGDVFTHPDRRGHGFTAVLMKDAIAYMAANRFPLSMLYGIMNFYHKYGYIEAVNAYKTQAPLKFLAGVEAPAGVAVRPFKPEDLKTLNVLYNRAFDGKTLAAERVEAAWYCIASPKTCFVATDKKDKPVGYITTSVRPEPPSLTFAVREAVAFDGETAAALAVFARDKARALYLNELEILQKPDTYFVEYLIEFGGVQTIKVHAEGEGQGMIRIVSLKDLLDDIQPELTARFRAKAGAPRGIQVCLKTDDAGQATLASGPGGIQILVKPSKGAIAIKTPQNALARLVVGYWGVDRFVRRIGAKRVPQPAVDLLATLFPPDTPFTCPNDYF